MSSVMELLFFGINAASAANLSQLPALIKHYKKRGGGGHFFYKDIFFSHFHCLPAELWDALPRGQYHMMIY